MTTRTKSLRSRLSEKAILVVPGAFDALSARVIEEAGFDAVYATGAGFANASFAVPDVGLISSAELFTHVARLSDAVELPVIVDADTGFGDILQVRRTIHELERTGAAAIQIEDQVLSKRCGHFDGHELVTTEKMLQKLSVALEARRDPDLVLIARTDARGTEGFDAAVARARAYAKAGADLIFVEALETEEELKLLPSLIDAPLIVNMVEGGKTPMMTAEELQDAGYKMVLYANTALRSSVHAVQDAMKFLYENGSTGALTSKIISWAERQRLLRLETYQDIEARHLGARE